MTSTEHSRLEQIFERYLARLDRHIRNLEQVSRRFSWARLAILLSGIAAAFVAVQLGSEILGWIVAGVFVSGFAVTAHFHARVERGIRRHRFWRTIKATHLARMRHDWANIPEPASIPVPGGHPYAVDLNLIGHRSLLHLIDTAVSHGGSSRLASWLLTSEPDIDEVKARQELVRELMPLGSFRDRLSLHGALVSRGNGNRWDGETLVEWLQNTPPKKSMMGYIVLLGLLAAVNIALVVIDVALHGPVIWPYTLALYVVLYMSKRGESGSLLDDSIELDLRLHQLRAVLRHLEGYIYRGRPNLARLCQVFLVTDHKPSAILKSVSRIASAASLQKNPLVRLLINLMMPWDLFFTERLNLAREKIRDRMPEWLNTWYELEALSSLANFGALNPGYILPEIGAVSASPLFDVEQIGHPLLPDASRVYNDFTVRKRGEMAVVTGSNMSGKSTFLRTLGVNVALSFAGGPVCATAFRTGPFRLFTCINVTDSVNDGISYFYAEVQRLKELLAALNRDHPFPLFFLIDEIFRGTNNRERLIGSRSYVRAIAGGNGVGLISTHDLELVHLADELPEVYNFHFRETIVDGRMVFDYRLRFGPSPTTNALEIMRMEGLPVDEQLP